jgi:hypothetical protein
VFFALLVVALVEVTSGSLFNSSTLWVASDPVAFVLVSIVEFIDSLSVTATVFEASLVDSLDRINSASITVLVAHISVALS